MSRRRYRRPYNPELEREYDRLIKSENFVQAVEVGHHLGNSFEYTAAKLERQRRLNQQRRIKERQERRLAIAQFYGVSPSWVRLEDEVVNHQTPGKPSPRVLASLRATAKVALNAVAVLLLQAAGH